MSDILAALAATEPGATGHRCKIGRWLDSLAGEPGHGDLMTAFETPTGQGGSRTLSNLCAIAARLGAPTSDNTIGDHRGGVCRCSW